MTKSIKKFFSLGALFLTSLFLFSSCQKGFRDQPPTSKEVLFVIHSATGYFQLRSGSDTEGRLILEGVNQSVAYFKDRESKETGSRNLSEFLSNWNQQPHAFSDHPPTAALVYHRADATGQSQSFEQINLTVNHPQYNASTDEVIFDFQLVGSPVHIPLGELQETTLFIDGQDKFSQQLIPSQKNPKQV